MATITMQRTEYDALLAASKAAVDAGASELDYLALRRTIDEANSITRYFLLIRWVELGAQQPTQLGQPWPPEQEFALELERPIVRDDVDQVLADQAIEPVTVLVTKDRNGNVGLTALDDWDFDLAT
jgi:hypothetical protein